MHCSDINAREIARYRNQFVAQEATIRSSFIGNPNAPPIPTVGLRTAFSYKQRQSHK